MNCPGCREEPSERAARRRVLRRAPLPPLPATHRGWLELTFSLHA